MIDLKPAYLKTVRKILSGNVPEYEVLVYGHRAEGKAKAYSYLDLAIMTDKPLAAARMEKITAAFTAARFPFRVETIDWAATGANFRKEIKRTAVVLQNSAK
ncbi:MAG: nucleotidyltransferase domain-containing protein [Elusimicrobia bacterium]|jgi:type I restriction enzyme S subunit|nr:nucleotidyltransferase domain-containing protein [Elusimicrobiota bacterium]